MPYNERKYQTRLLEPLAEDVGKVQAVNEKRHRTRSQLQTLRAEVLRYEAAGRKVTPALLAELLEAEQALSAIEEHLERVRAEWQEHAAVVERCNEFLRDRGVKIPEVTHSVAAR